MYLRGPDCKDECCDDTPLEGVFEFELGSEVRSVSIMGGFGDRDGLECLDMAEGDREDGKDDNDVRRFVGAVPLVFHVAAAVSVVEDDVARVDGSCMSSVPLDLAFVSLVVR